MTEPSKLTPLQIASLLDELSVYRDLFDRVIEENSRIKAENAMLKDRLAKGQPKHKLKHTEITYRVTHDEA